MGARRARAGAAGRARHRYADREYLVPPWLDEQEDSVVTLLYELAIAGVEVPIDELAEDWWDLVTSAWMVERLGEERRSSWRRWTEDDHRRLLQAFADLGVLAVRGVRRTRHPYGGFDEEGGTVALTDAGRVAAYALAEAEGITAPLAGELRDRPATELLGHVARLPPDHSLA